MRGKRRIHSYLNWCPVKWFKKLSNESPNMPNWNTGFPLSHQIMIPTTEPMQNTREAQYWELSDTIFASIKLLEWLHAVQVFSGDKVGYKPLWNIERKSPALQALQDFIRDVAFLQASLPELCIIFDANF